MKARSDADRRSSHWRSARSEAADRPSHRPRPSTRSRSGHALVPDAGRAVPQHQAREVDVPAVRRVVRAVRIAELALVAVVGRSRRDRPAARSSAVAVHLRVDPVEHAVNDGRVRQRQPGTGRSTPASSCARRAVRTPRRDARLASECESGRRRVERSRPGCRIEGPRQLLAEAFEALLEAAGVRLLGARERLEPLGDFGEALVARRLGEARVHLGVLVGLALDGGLEVLLGAPDRLARWPGPRLP